MNSKRLKSLSIFFPCYNDKGTISDLVKEAFVVGAKITHKLEVIVIDDGSTDGSRKILRELKKNYKNFRVIFHKSNKGYGGALQSGFKSARYEFVFYTDGDLQYTLTDLPVLVNLIDNDVDFVNGIKIARQDPMYRVIAGNIYALAVRWFFWLPIYDVDCDFRLIRRSILKKVDLKYKSGAICVELVKKSHIAGAQFRQVSVHHKKRPHGRSQFFRPVRIFSTLLDLTSLWFEIYAKSRISKTV